MTVRDFDEYLTTRVGARVGNYTIERLLGAGGMAAVYMGVHRRNGHRVAVKMLHPHVAIAGDIQERFLHEGFLANKVGHRGAVEVMDEGVADDGSVFLVMELLSGTTVDALWVKHGQRLPLAQAIELGRQLLDVLASAHANGVVHRDLKPENLFLTDEGQLKVLDFGIARLLDDSRKKKTATGRAMGTPAFMPPEQALGRSREIDGQTDLWSVGATLFTLLSGEFVHEAETAQEMLVRAGSVPARPLASVAPSVPSAVAAVVDRALLFQKSARWSDARAMLTALESAYASACAGGDPRRISDDARAALAATVSAAVAKAGAIAATVDDPALGVGVAPARGATQAASSPPNLADFDTDSMTELAVPAFVPPYTPPYAAPRALSTTAGMSFGAPARSAVGPPVTSKRARSLALGAAGAVVLAVGVAAFGVHTVFGSGAAPSTVVGSLGAPPSATLGATPPIALTPMSTASPDVIGTPAEPTAGATASPTARPTATSAAPVAAAPVTKGAPISSAAPSKPRRGETAPVEPSAPAPTAKAPSCVPPYTIDPTGRKIFKPECF